MTSSGAGDDVLSMGLCCSKTVFGSEDRIVEFECIVGTKGDVTVRNPELNKALEEYAQLYQLVYGDAESIETLLPFMLSAFLAKDRAFVAYHKNRRVPSVTDRK